MVTKAGHMSGKWEKIPQSSRDVGQSKVSDFVKAGGKDYSLIRGDVCHTARKNMSKLP